MSDLVAAVTPLYGKLDVLIFNPPYCYSRCVAAALDVAHFLFADMFLHLQKR